MKSAPKAKALLGVGALAISTPAIAQDITPATPIAEQVIEEESLSMADNILYGGSLLISICSLIVSIKALRNSNKKLKDIKTFIGPSVPLM